MDRLFKVDRETLSEHERNPDANDEEEMEDDREMSKATQVLEAMGEMLGQVTRGPLTKKVKTQAIALKVTRKKPKAASKKQTKSTIESRTPTSLVINSRLVGLID